MANVQHKNLQHASVHECKHITTSVVADSGKVITPSDTAPGTSVLRRLNDTDLDYTDKTKNIYGWNDISDSQYTSGSPLAIASGVRTLLPNNGLAAQSDTSRLGGLWVPGSSKFVIDDLNAFYILQVSAKITAAAAAGTPYTVLYELETSNGPTVIRATNQAVKGGGAINSSAVAWAFYVGPFINATDLKIYVTPDTNINLYQIGFVLNRTYKES